MLFLQSILLHFLYFMLCHFRIIKEIDNLLTLVYSTGVVSLIVILIIAILSIKKIRKTNYNIFCYSHFIIYLFVIILVFHSIYFVIHISILIIYSLFKYVFKIRKVKKNNLISNNKNFIVLQLFIKNINKENYFYNGDYVYLNCYQISKLELRPFTIIDLQEDYDFNKITLGISKSGDWKSKLYNTIIKNNSISLHNYGLDFIIIGPFKGALRKVYNSKNVVFYIQNIGITTFISYLYYISIRTNQTIPRRVQLFWSVYNKYSLEYFLEEIYNFKNMKIKSISYSSTIFIRNEEYI